MTKFKTILRLASLGLSQRQIAHSCQVGQATISDYLAQAKQARKRPVQAVLRRTPLLS